MRNPPEITAPGEGRKSFFYRYWLGLLCALIYIVVATACVLLASGEHSAYGYVWYYSSIPSVIVVFPIIQSMPRTPELLFCYRAGVIAIQALIYFGLGQLIHSTIQSIRPRHTDAPSSPLISPCPKDVPSTYHQQIPFASRYKYGLLCAIVYTAVATICATLASGVSGTERPSVYDHIYAYASFPTAKLTSALYLAMAKAGVSWPYYGT